MAASLLKVAAVTVWFGLVSAVDSAQLLTSSDLIIYIFTIVTGMGRGDGVLPAVEFFRGTTLVSF